MKNALLHHFSILVISISLPSVFFAQPKMAATVKADLEELMGVSGRGGDIRSLSNRFHFHSVNDEPCVAVLVKVTSDFSVVKTKEKGIHIGTVIKDIVTLKVPVQQLSSIYELEGVSAIELAGKVQPLVDRIDYDTRLDSVKMAIDLSMEYSGDGVYIGIVDWGYDYTHPAYYDTLMDNYRIVAAWDQFKTSGPHPVGFDYGTEYVGKQALLEAGSDTSNVYGYAHHGGHVASIAAGGGAGTPYKGVAYDAELLFATFLIDVAAVIDVYEWMYQKAQEAGKRLVINQSWGLYHIGTLDGTSLLSQAIDNYSDLGVVFTSSAGNNGSASFHIEKEFETTDTLFTGVSFSNTSSPHFWGQSISAWGTPEDAFSIGFQVYNASQQLIQSSPYYSTVETTAYIDSFLVAGNDTVFYNVSMEQENPFNQRPHARLRVRRASSALHIVLGVAANSGHIHAWNVAELTTDVGNMGANFTNFGPKSIAGDRNYGVGEPACTESVVAVASHQAGMLSPTGGLIGGSISNFSSYGPIYDGRLKPDVSAPGANIAGAISSFTESSVNYIESVDFNDKTYGFARLSGTSMSSPVVAGVAALMLQANPSLTATEVRTILMQTAYSDTRTGEIGEEGDTRWGWGKVDAYNAIKEALKLASVENPSKASALLVAYPNPTTDVVAFKNIQPNEMIYIYNELGQLIDNRILEEERLDITTYANGVYFFKVASTNQLLRVMKM